MKEEQEMVREFHEKAGATIGTVPSTLSENDRVLRMKLIAEELDELTQAFGLTPAKPFGQMNITDVADALGDLLYVVLGTAVSCGIDIKPIFHEIHRSNMTKFIDGYRRPDGKWIKGPSYSPANLEPLLAVQADPQPRP
jgi:predicted HAD superfamily Cof-like phosphohydrolase